MRVVVVVAACLFAFAGFAQDAPPETPPAPEAAAEAEAEAAALYRLGLDLAGKGQYAEACGVFDRVTKDHAGSPYAGKAEEQMALAALAEGGAACGGAPPAEVVAAEEEQSEELPPDGFARRLALSRGKGDDDGKVELVISQALMGPLLFGVGIPGAASFDEPWLYLSGGLVGLGLGIGVPLAVTAKRPVTVGQAMTIFSGEILGSWNGVFLTAAIAGDTGNPLQLVAAGGSGGFIVGAGAGIASAISLKPTSGQASIFRSGFTWGTYFGGMTVLLANGQMSTTATWLTLGLGSDIGAGLGALGAAKWPISRSRMNVVNLSGYAGALGVGLIYGIISLAGNETSAPVWGGILSVGAAGGLVAGAFLTKNMDERRMAWIGGGTPIALEDGRWRLGMPMPLPRIAQDGTIGVDLQIASGRW